jgi:hypothetical protein
MIYLETGNLYFNTQVYFRKTFIDDLPNCDNVWKETYYAWLETQGASVIKSGNDVIRTALGVAPGYDRFGFKDDHDATIFALRWA